jgi:phosphoribosylformylglycinamidine cyclo-ligase
MGIGYVVVVPANQAEKTIQWFESQAISAYQIGEVIEGTGELLGIPS